MCNHFDMKPVIAFLVGAVGGLLFLAAFAIAVLSKLGPYLAAFSLLVVVIAVVAAVCVSQNSQPGARPYWEQPAGNSHSSHSGSAAYYGPLPVAAVASPPLPRVGYPQSPALPQPPTAAGPLQDQVVQQAAPVASAFRQRRHGSRFVARVEVGQ